MSTIAFVMLLDNLTSTRTLRARYKLSKLSFGTLPFTRDPETGVSGFHSVAQEHYRRTPEASGYGLFLSTRLRKLPDTVCFP